MTLMTDSVLTLGEAHPGDVASRPAGKGVIHHIQPISRGPYLGFDWLVVVSDMCNTNFSVVRSTMDGRLISESEKVDSEEKVQMIIESLRMEQYKKDDYAITGGGRWSAD